MATTTLRIEEELKSRVAAAAGRAGQSPHAFMLEAIAQQVEQAELDEALHRVADARWAAVEAGETVGWDEARAWVEGRLRGEQPARPVPRMRAR